MQNPKLNVKLWTWNMSFHLPKVMNARKTGQENARAALPAEASREEPQNLRTERDSLLDRVIRLQAEIEDIRKRAAKEQDETRKDTLVDAIKILLPIFDST